MSVHKDKYPDLFGDYDTICTCDRCNTEEINMKLFKFEGDNEQLCENCVNSQIQSDLYEAYKEDWCKIRGYKLEDVDEEIGINGECYVCFEEFLDNEYRDEDYRQYLSETYGYIIDAYEIDYIIEEPYSDGYYDI